MKDRQGVLRGSCSQCPCRDYQLPASGNACDYCGHYPINHQEQQQQQGTPSIPPPPPPQQQQPIQQNQAAIQTQQQNSQKPPQQKATAREQFTPTMPAVAVTSKPKQKAHKSPQEWLKDKIKTKKS